MRKKLAAAAVALACVLCCCACSGTVRLAAFDEYNRFGTQVRWVYVPSETEDAQAIWSQLTANAAAIEEASSAEFEESAIDLFNKAEPGERVTIGKEAYEMLSAAQKIYEETKGNEETKGTYNPATGLLVDLWGFSPRHRAADYAPEKPYDRENFLEELPDKKYIDAFLQPEMLNFGAVELTEEDGKYYARKPADAWVTVEGDETVYTMQLNLGGIGKGYCADAAADVLRAAGQRYGYYNLGGSSMMLLADPSSDGGIWEVGANSPRSFSALSHYATIRARDVALSTSGDYEQYYEIGGVRYCHIIDPDSGYPVGGGSHVVCATVVGGSAAEGDARATAFCCMQLDEALAYASAHAQQFHVLFVWYEASTNEYIAYSNLEGWQLEESSIRAEVIA